MKSHLPLTEITQKNVLIGEGIVDELIYDVLMLIIKKKKRPHMFRKKKIFAERYASTKEQTYV